MNERINDKIIDIERFLEELESILPKDLEEYLKDWKAKAICERHFEKIIEAIVDLTFLIIKEKKFELPKDVDSSFDILSNHQVITKNLAETFKDAKGMRNILAHEYGKIDDKLVFEAVTEQLINDVKEFINQIEKNNKRV